jgi:uncharacterized protein (DUF1800 family)
LARQKDSKLATEKAAFTKAAAEEKAAANAQITKLIAEVAAAEKSLQHSALALKDVADTTPAQDSTGIEKAIKAYVTALGAAAEQMAALKAGLAPTQTGEMTAALTEADQVVAKATAAQQQARQDVQNKVKALTESTNRLKALREAAEKRVAKIRAQKDLEREQETAKRAEAARHAAEETLAARTRDLEKAQAVYAAALKTAVKVLAMSPEKESSLRAERATIKRLLADKESEIKKENEASARAAAEAQSAAEKAQAVLTAADKLVAERLAMREALNKVTRQRYFRDAGAIQNDLRLLELDAAAANRDLQAKTSAFNKAAAELERIKNSTAKAQKDAAAQAALLAKAAKDKEAAEKSAQEKETAAKLAEQKAGEARQAATAARSALEKTLVAYKTAERTARDTSLAVKNAEQSVATAQAALDKVAAEKKAADRVVAGHQAGLKALPIQVAEAKAAAYGGLKPLPASAWDYAKARHLLVRAGFGGTPEEVARLHALGLHGAVAQLVHFADQPFADVPFAAYPKERADIVESSYSSEDQRRNRERRAARERQQIQNMRTWWLARMIQSPRPLEEKLTLFWHGQIPVQYSDVGDSYYMYLQNQLFRDNAAGNFATLLHGIAHDAAMLKYLNNDTNVKGRANENLAREIMELFSMGRDQGYSETDIRQGARALTGYTYDLPSGQFRYVSQRHDDEAKTIFGKSGTWSGDDFVNLILETPYPPRFVARQMFVFFAHDDPANDTIDALATVLRLSNYELAPMLENLFLSEEFYGKRAMATQIKSPVQLIVGLHRDLGLKNPDLAYLAGAVRDMGQDLFEPPSVFSWQGGRTWVNTSRAFSRYNALAGALERRRSGASGTDLVGTLLAGQKFQNHAEVVDYLIKCCLSVPLSESKRQALIEFLGPLPPPASWEANRNAVNARLTRLLEMLICSPEYQLG